MLKAATLAEVAAAADVSMITASRAISGVGYVAKSTRRRVLEASQRVGYVPRAAARAMRRGRHYQIACAVVRYGQMSRASWPNMHSYLDVASDYLAERGYSLVLEPLHLDVETHHFIGAPRLFTELAVDAVVGIAGAPVTPAIDQQLSLLQVPTVWCNRDDAEVSPCFCCDEQAGGALLVDHLHQLGHTHIGYIGTVSPHYSANARRQGMLAALKRLDLSDQNVVCAEQQADVYDLIQQVVSRRPTALICYNRQYYDVCLHVLARDGMRVPRDMSVCYFGSAWENQPLEPGTMAVLPEEQMSLKAVDMLLAMIDGKKPGKPRTAMPPALKLGHTTAPPNCVK